MPSTLLFLYHDAYAGHSWYEYEQTGLAQAFEALGHTVRVVRYREEWKLFQDEKTAFLDALKDPHLDAVIDLGCRAHALSKVKVAGSAASLLEQRGIKYVALLADHPKFQNLGEIRARAFFVGCMDRSHLDACRLLYPHVQARFFFLPRAVAPADPGVRPGAPLCERPIPLFFFGNLYHIDDRFWQTRPPGNRQLYQRTIDTLRAHETLPLHQALEQAIAELKVRMPASQAERLVLLHDAVSHTETYLRNVKRYEYVRALVAAGLPVTVCGNGWADTPIADRLTLLAPRGFNEILALLRQSRIALSMTGYPDGLYDRALHGIDQGAVCVHSDARYMKECFPAGEQVHYVPWPALAGLADTVRSLLARGPALEEATQAARQTLQTHHTYAQRAQAILTAIGDPAAG